MIRNIIFDLGEVIVHVDTQASIDAFNTLKNGAVDQHFSFQKQSTLFDRFERGQIQASEFRSHIRKILELDVDDQAIDQAWNAMLQDVPLEKLELLLHLQSTGKKVFALSNTNIIHISCISDFLRKHYGANSLNHYFTNVYYSYEMGCRKPEIEAYNYVIEQEKISAEETLFIDDRIENIEVAKSLHMKSIHLTERYKLFEMLNPFI